MHQKLQKLSQMLVQAGRLIANSIAILIGADITEKLHLIQQ